MEAHDSVLESRVGRPTSPSRILSATKPCLSSHSPPRPLRLYPTHIAFLSPPVCDPWLASRGPPYTFVKPPKRSWPLDGSYKKHTFLQLEEIHQIKWSLRKRVGVSNLAARLVMKMTQNVSKKGSQCYPQRPPTPPTVRSAGGSVFF